jgi:hypothetical protein
VPNAFRSVCHSAGLPMRAARLWRYGGVGSPPRVEGGSVREKRREAERWNGTEKRSREHPGGLYFAGARRWRQGQAARAATRYLRR